MDEQRMHDAAAMWCDLFVAHAAAKSAHFAVTRRAELYVRVAGLPLDRVYDALEIDEAGWAERLADLRANEKANRDAWRGRDEASA